MMVPVSGGEVWAEDSGGAGPALVLLHPGWGDSSIWDPVVARLPGRCRVIRHDVRGYGKSPAPSVPYAALDDLAAVLDYCAVSRAVLAGHSGGGGTALQLAVTDPQRTAALILLAPGVPDYPWPEDDPFFRELGELARAADRDGIAALGLRTWAAGGPGPAALAQVRGAVDAMFRQGDFEQPGPPAFDRLGEIRVPAVIVTGELEYPMVAACCEQIAARIPGSRQITVAGADHLLPLRAPAEIAGLVRQYLP
ncbi:MAG TPA: alpha/beta hydrolase [Streptosporangiaceae bacterium]